MNCLNCQREIDPETAKLSSKVLVCVQCHEMAESFTRSVLKDIRDMHDSLGDFLRAMLRTGSLKPGALASKQARVEALVRWMEGVRELRCLSSQTPAPPPPTSSSGESLPPHVATLAAIGRRSSSSPTG